MQSLLKRVSLQRLVHIVVFDLVWFAAVAGRDPWLWVTIPLIGLMFVVNWKPLLLKRKSLLFFVLLGLFAEWLVIQLGVLRFTGTEGLPAWLIWLWIGFAAMAFTAMDWLGGRYIVCALFGLIFGPITYLAGVGFGAAEMLTSMTSLVIAYALMWGGLMTVFCYLAAQHSRANMNERQPAQ